MGRWMMPRVNDNNSLGTQMTFLLDYDKEKVSEGHQGNIKI